MCEVENEDAVGAAPTILFPTKVRLKLKVLRYFMIAHFFIPVVTKPNGVPCAFPFFYNGQSYTSCTQDGDRGDAWCATVNQLADDSDLWDPCYLICELCIDFELTLFCYNGPLTRHVKLWIVHALGIPGMFSPLQTSKETVS